MGMNEVLWLANTIYGEAASEDYNTMHMVGSTIINRVRAKKAEFGFGIPEVCQKGYYAVKNQNTPYRNALEQNFTTKKAQNQYKQALAIASGLYRGTIKPQPGQFYLTAKELKKTKMDLKLLNKVGKVGKYTVLSYAPPQEGSKPEGKKANKKTKE